MTTAGIYTGQWDDGAYNPYPIIKSGDSCTNFDDMAAVDGTEEPMLVESVAIERDGFRENYLCVSVACGALVVGEEDDDEGDWGGIYCANIETKHVQSSCAETCKDGYDCEYSTVDHSCIYTIRSQTANFCTVEIKQPNTRA